MNRDNFMAVRFRDNVIKERIFEARQRIVGKCTLCDGSGFSPLDDSGRLPYCKCMKRFTVLKNVIISGVPREALELYDLMKKSRGGLSDVEYKEVVMAVNEHEIWESTRKKELYASLLTPFSEHADEALGRGDSILLFGTNSRGKTWGLYYLALELSAKHSVLFMPLKELFICINAAYYGSDNSRDAAASKQAAIEMLELIRDVDLLLLDEASKLPKFSESVSVQLEGIVKDRVGNGRSVVMATNHTPHDFHKTFGPQVVSAFIKNMYCVHLLNGPDLRHKAMKKTKAFGYVK